MDSRNIAWWVWVIIVAVVVLIVIGIVLIIQAWRRRGGVITKRSGDGGSRK